MNTEDMCPTCNCPPHPNEPCSEAVLYHNHVDDAYFDLLNLIKGKGVWSPNRTGIDTLGVFGAQAKFDVSLDAFPILTTKKVWFKGIVHELLWFLKGDTNIKYLVDNGVGIWDEWAYKKYITHCRAERDKLVADGCEVDYQEPTMEKFVANIKSDSGFAVRYGDLGMGTYGGMWRDFPYHRNESLENLGFNAVGEGHEFGHVDQIQKVLDKLKSNPTDRRMIVSAWHPYWVDHCALPPCHCLFHFNTQELTLEERHNLYRRANILAEHYINLAKSEPEITDEKLHRYMDAANIPARRLNVLLYQRSCDSFLGVPFNITSYCLLLAMVAHVSGMEPGVFTHTYGDLHIYRNHMEQVEQQLTRSPKLLPKLWLNPAVKNLFDFKFEDIKLIGYDPHPAIKAEVAV